MQLTEIGVPDLERIRSLALKVWQLTYQSILKQVQIDYMLDRMYSLSSLTQQIEEKGHHFYIVKNEEGDLGFVSCEFHYQNLPITKIHKIYVLQDSQGKGIGKALVERVCCLALKNGDHQITLNVNRYNQAEKFYEQIGFKKVRDENIPIGNGFLMEDFVMEKTI